MYFLVLTDDVSADASSHIEDAVRAVVVGRHKANLGVLRDCPRRRALRTKQGRQVGPGNGWVLYREPPAKPGEPEPEEIVGAIPAAVPDAH